MRKIILFGAGKHGEKLLNIYGKERVAFFCDNNYPEKEKHGIAVISFDELKKIHRDYRVIIALEFSRTTLDVGEQLNNAKIEYESAFTLEKCLHAYKVGDDWKFDFEEDLVLGFIRKRFLYGTIPMLKDMIQKYDESIIGNVSFYIYGGDYASEADECRRVLRLNKIFSYSSSKAVAPWVIPIPDYKFYYSGYSGSDITEDCDKIYEMIRNEGMRKWIDDRAFWCGNILNAEARYNLMIMAERYPQRLQVRAYYDSAFGFTYGKENFVKMQDFMNYKYLIDIRGWGWTDRVKLLLAMGRPLLLVDRPFTEYYFDKLKPNVHYVPIKEDLSDLIEKIEYLDTHANTYNEIVNNARQFTKDNFSKDEVVRVLYESCCM